ncbi:hypothetical protein NLX83_13580 [Allokutzneria sp. A3M-2-11 16]|uniref:hypothetical protein n=1 Tax=Allokutzneria sp. A3M-2-11 16 TaxID=2962043 RepID=UPI0020B83EE0|nr:hypothetical protein [Allokutzneria sp. A3M-2-11 16]MCP3800289.1 hypothetical protein [Allokutzneria sp. A3M-2-11 16]
MRLLLLVGVFASVLVGCSQQSQTGSPASSVSSAPAQAAVTTTTAPQGPIAKKLGDKAGMDCPGSTIDSCAVQYTITKLTGCTGGGYAGGAPPAGTRRQLVWIEVSTGSAYDPSRAPSSSITRFQAISAQGVTTGGELNPSSSWKCAPEKDRMGFGDDSWMPNRKYVGAVEIHLPNDAVKIVNGEGRWEWSIS